MDEPRLIDIETRITFQEDALRQLGDVLAKQQRDIDRLARLCQALQSRLEAAADHAPGSPAHEPPPHY